MFVELLMAVVFLEVDGQLVVIHGNELIRS
jgi:hypothetical protein